jgi:hypothetical protein
MIVKFRDAFPPTYGIAPYINNLLNNVANAKQKANIANAGEQIAYIKEKINK